ncbi:MAG: Lrp/AsnC family transcriptional regulator [Rhodobacterales bacterium]
MDDTDKRLIAALAANARLPVSTLAADLGLARTTVQARIDRLERSGIIAGYTVRLTDAATAARIHATALLQIDPQKQAGIIGRLKVIDNVQQAFTTSGRFDLVLQLVTDTTAELDMVLDRIGALDGVKSSESLIRLSRKIDRAI